MSKFDRYKKAHKDLFKKQREERKALNLKLAQERIAEADKKRILKNPPQRSMEEVEKMVEEGK